MPKESIEGGNSAALPTHRAEAGRLELGLEVAIPLQIELMRLMLPEDIRTILRPSDGETIGGIEDDLFIRWNDQYAESFADFCNEHVQDVELMGRLKNQTLTDEDYQSLVDYLQSHAEEKGAFLKPAEITELVLKYGH